MITQQAFLTRYDLFSADECFMIGTGAEIVPVVQIDGRHIGGGEPGPVMAIIPQQFAARCRCDGVKAVW